MTPTYINGQPYFTPAQLREATDLTAERERKKAGDWFNQFQEVEDFILDTFGRDHEIADRPAATLINILKTAGDEGMPMVEQEMRRQLAEVVQTDWTAAHADLATALRLLAALRIRLGIAFTDLESARTALEREKKVSEGYLKNAAGSCPACAEAVACGSVGPYNQHKCCPIADRSDMAYAIYALRQLLQVSRQALTKITGTDQMINVIDEQLARTPHPMVTDMETAVAALVRYAEPARWILEDAEWRFVPEPNIPEPWVNPHELAEKALEFITAPRVAPLSPQASSEAGDVEPICSCEVKGAGTSPNCEFCGTCKHGSPPSRPCPSCDIEEGDQVESAARESIVVRRSSGGFELSNITGPGIAGGTVSARYTWQGGLVEATLIRPCGAYKPLWLDGIIARDILEPLGRKYAAKFASETTAAELSGP
jgi:hypothetical protein